MCCIWIRCVYVYIQTRCNTSFLPAGPMYRPIDLIAIDLHTDYFPVLTLRISLYLYYGLLSIDTLVVFVDRIQTAIQHLSHTYNNGTHWNSAWYVTFVYYGIYYKEDVLNICRNTVAYAFLPVPLTMRFLIKYRNQIYILYSQTVILVSL